MLVKMPKRMSLSSSGCARRDGPAPCPPYYRLSGARGRAARPGPQRATAHLARHLTGPHGARTQRTAAGMDTPAAPGGRMAAIQHRTVETNGIRMHIAEQGTGPLVVLCHGFPESW